MNITQIRRLSTALASSTAHACLLLVLISGTVGAPATVQAQPDVIGQWSAVQAWPIVSVHTHLLPTGKVMFYPYGDDSRLWDPANNSITTLPKVGYNIFCTGHSFIGDGRLLVTGGHISNNHGLNDASYYDAFANIWTRLPDMTGGRWYPSGTTLANGDVLVTSGDDENANNNDLPQVWQVSSATWRSLTSARLQLPLYPRTFLAPNGKVFFATSTSRYLDTAGAWATVGNTRTSGRDNYGSACLYDTGRILWAGGGDPPLASCEIIDLNAPSPAWAFTGSMAQPRRQNNVTLLPDGTVLVTGGSSGAGFNNGDFPVLSAEMWNPSTGTWAMMASATQYRGYHSCALLLPDGRVLSSGGDSHPNAEIYSPPYLFQGPRPAISSAPASVSYADTFFVGTPDAADITSVIWLRPGSVTHAQNWDQRLIRLSFSQAPGGLNVTAPSNVNLCPPGYYLLFILNGTSVPSVARFVRIAPNGSPNPPAAPTNLRANSTVKRKINLSWTQSASPGVSQNNVYRATTAGGPYSLRATLNPTTSYQNTGLTSGTTYYYVVTAVGSGGESPYSNVASAGAR